MVISFGMGKNGLPAVSSPISIEDPDPALDTGWRGLGAVLAIHLEEAVTRSLAVPLL
jgi:hypothetical protein